MTKEQEEAIENLTDLLKQRNEKQVEITTYDLFENIETVLSMLKENSAEIHQKNTELAEKNAEIEKYKKLLADNLARELNNSIKAKEKANTDLEFLNLGWKTEIEKKDKMIDLIIDFFYKLTQESPGTTIHYLEKNGFDTSKCNNCSPGNDCRKCFKQYFERKAE